MLPRVLACLTIVGCLTLQARADDKRLSLLFLGDGGHHEPAKRAETIKPVLAARNIDFTYTTDTAALSKENLAKYDGVLVYRDSGDLPPESEQALIEFVENGKGLIPVHCASHTFRNSKRYGALVGGRFHKHDAAIFRARIIDAQHPAMKDVKSFEAWDETYTHNELTSDIRVLMARLREDGGYEPWTWVRKQGKGRVYYTASGHDDRTWKHPGFHQLLESGIRWACGQLNENLPPPELIDAAEGLPNYVAGEKWGTEADRVMKMPKPLDPASSMKHMHVPEGFQVSLVASEPQIVKPICMTFDHRGRMWIVESLDYPNRLLDNPHQTGNDQIKICEDTDGDGKADKFTVFADKLNIPTSITPYKDGVLAVIAPYIVHLRDTNGDDVCDQREIVLSGFGRGDTHAVASNLHYCLDNWIWGVCGYSGGRVRQGADGKILSQRFGQCVFRFKPDGTAFEVVTPTSNNTWGLGISEDGDVFASTANNDHSVHVALPNRLYENVRGWHGVGSKSIADHVNYHPIADDVRQMDWHGKFTAASGHELYTARQFPKEYWNRAAFVCEPTGHLIHLNWLVPKGSGFIARDGYNFFASTDPWTSPIAAQVGPDGALWVIDWYNYIIQHNPTPHGFKTGRGQAYETTLRDKKHGRIYRIAYGNIGKPAVKIADATPQALIKTLASDNLFWRLQGQRLLAEQIDERGFEELKVIAEVGKATEGELSPVQWAHLLRAIAAYAEIGGDKARPTDKLLELAKKHLDAGNENVSRAVIATVAKTSEGCELLVKLKLHENKNFRVRREALLALAEMPPTANAAAAVRNQFTIVNDDDRWLFDATTAAAARNSVEFLSGPFGSTTAMIDPVPIIRTASEAWARSGDQAKLRGVLANLANSKVRYAEAFISGVARGWPSDSKVEITPDIAESLGEILKRVSPASQLELVALAKRWGAAEQFAELTKKLTETLAQQVGDEAAKDEIRLAAAKQLVATGDEAAVDAVLGAITPRTAPQLATGLLDALAEGRSDKIGAAIVERLGEFSPAARRAALAVLLRRGAWSTALLDAVEKRTIALDELSLDQRHQLASHPTKSIAERAAKMLAEKGGLPSADRVKVVEKFLTLTKTAGDAAAGKKLFVDNCAKCHKHSGQGENIGPDLTGMAAHPKSEIIVHVLDPNRSVEGNFRQHQVLTLDGQLLGGLLIAETRTAVELVDAEAKRHVVLRDDIDRMTASQQSLMPEGFEKLGEKGMVDLLEFLSAKGKYFPLPLAKAANVVSTKGGMFQGDGLDYEKLVFPTWGQQVSGGIPFQVIDPLGTKIPNTIVLHGPRNPVTRAYPKSVTLPCNAKAKAIHLLSGVSGWGHPYDRRQSVSMIVRLHYADGKPEDHELVNGKHFADFAGATDVPESKLAFRLRGQQIRHITISPKRSEVIERVELVKGDDQTAPVVMAITVESP